MPSALLAAHDPDADRTGSLGADRVTARRGPGPGVGDSPEFAR
jgi:hypothetical protein